VIVLPRARRRDAVRDVFLHKTGPDSEMPNPRYALESWLFGPSGFPGDYAPLAL